MPRRLAPGFGANGPDRSVFDPERCAQPPFFTPGDAVSNNEIGGSACLSRVDQGPAAGRQWAALIQIREAEPIADDGRLKSGFGTGLPHDVQDPRHAGLPAIAVPPVSQGHSNGFSPAPTGQTAHCLVGAIPFRPCVPPSGSCSAGEPGKFAARQTVRVAALAWAGGLSLAHCCREGRGFSRAKKKKKNGA